MFQILPVDQAFDASPSAETKLYDLASPLGLDADIHRDRDEQEKILDACLARAAAKSRINADELDIDGGKQVPAAGHGASVGGAVGNKRRERQKYSEQPLQVLHRQLL